MPNLFKRSIWFLFSAILLAYTTFWFVERWLFENILEKILTSSSTSGIQVTHSELTATGFPDDLVFKLREIRVKSGDFHFYAPSLIIRPGLFFPLKHQFSIQVEETPRLTFRNYRGKGSYFRGRVVLDAFRFKGVELDLESLFVLRDKVPFAKISQGKLMLHTIEHPSAPPVLEGALSGILENWVKEMRLQGNAQIRVDSRFKVTQLASLLKGQEGLRRWKEQKGSVQIEKIAFILPQMDFVFEGLLDLDETLQFKGDFILKLQGFQRLFNVLAEHGVNERDLTFLRLSLVFFDRDQDGSLSIPFSLQAKRFYLLGIPLPFSF